VWLKPPSGYPAGVTATRIVLAPGASGSITSLAPHCRGLERRGFSVELVELPRGKAERAVPIYRDAVAEHASDVIIGGQSFGARVATLIAPEVKPAAVVCLSYPLHAPGRQEAWRDRTSHWPSITCPVLLLSGESDPFANLDLLRQAATLLTNGRLITYPNLGHHLAPVLDAVLDEIARFAEVNT
jgi:predicted alpha/beta-hydrolase family hydrolase